MLFLFSGSQMAFTMITAGAAFICVDLLRGSEADVALIMGPFLATALLTFPLTPWLSKKYGWEKGVVTASNHEKLMSALSGLDITIIDQVLSERRIIDLEKEDGSTESSAAPKIPSDAEIVDLRTPGEFEKGNLDNSRPSHPLSIIGQKFESGP